MGTLIRDGVKIGGTTVYVDSELSTISTNAIQNKAVTNALNEKANSSDLSTVATTGNYSDLINTPIIDSSLSTTSTNAVENKVITGELNEKYPINYDIALSLAEWEALGNEKYYDHKNYYVYDAGVPTEKTVIYGWHIDPDESDPDTCITYLKDAVGLTPASMGSTSFNYGSWQDVFFMPKPCMVKFDGTVDYYLDPNDYSKKTDGTTSDVSNINYRGNAMVEWPLIWWKYEAGSVDGEGNFYVSNRKVDNTYQCWSNINSNNDITDHFYTSIYNGTIAPPYDSTKTYNEGDYVTYSNAEYKCITTISTAEAWDSAKWEKTNNVTPMRSISGIITNPTNGNGSTTGTVEVNRALALNTTSDVEWYTDTWSDRMLINGLLILMSKSLNCQKKFGQGITNAAPDKTQQQTKETYITGTLDDKGMFYGNTTNEYTPVKTFGMENWWGLVWHRTAGMIGMTDGTIKVKMTYNTADGSTATSYNSTGDGYIDLTNITGVRPTGNYVKTCYYTPYGYIPKITGNGASSTLYYCDYWYTNNTALTYLLCGGGASVSSSVGFSYFNLYRSFGLAGWYIGASPSLKPLVGTARA